ncbi:MAG: amino acid adenylation domain-containing protein, partial [Syntrophothermus sp.]
AGVTGEIYIGGNGLARGYLKKPGLTAEKFIPDPFSVTPGERLYKTGDLGIWLEDGSLEFKGRADRQIKIRGYRVEPDEITAVIISTGKAEDAAVFMKKYEDGIDRLTAYIILKKDSSRSFDVTAFRQELRTKLPSYMVPSQYVIIDSFPRTSTGKINYSALPDASEQDDTGSVTAKSDTPGKELLSNIWMEVLKLKNIKDDENFFELGGHSLLATQLVARIRDVFRIDLPLLSLFKYPTISKLDTEINRLMQEQNGCELPELKPALNSSCLLSFAQKRLWFLDQLSEVKTSYNIPSAFRITGTFSTFAFELALKVVTKRHQVLRTSFHDTGGIPFCNVDAEDRIDLSIIDITGIEDPLPALDNEIAKFASKPFDLTVSPLLRAAVFLVTENETVVLFVMHHIISDGWSQGILIKEISAAYAAFATDSNPELPELNISYSDYAAWQQMYFNSSSYEKSLKYWKDKLRNIPSVLDLPFDRPRPAVMTFNGSSIDAQLPAGLLSDLQKLSRENNATLFMTMLAAFQTLLFRYTGQSRIPIGAPIAGRTHTGLTDLIGFFVNNLVLTSDICPSLKFSDHLQNVRNSTLEAYAHQFMPFEKLVEELHPVRDLSHSPLFQVMFVFQNLPENTAASFPLELEPYRTGSNQANFELSIIISELPEGLNIEAEYNTDLFDQRTIKNLLDHYLLILKSITEDPDQKIGYLPVLSREEENTISYEWNNTSCSFEPDITVHRLFERIAGQQPSAPALLFMKDEYSPLEELNYHDLNALANALAYCLAGAGLGPERNAGVCLGKSFGMIAGIMGILKTGAAFVPIDPRFPRERIEYITADSGLELLITQRSLEDKFSGLPVNVIYLDELLPALIPVNNNLNFVDTAPENLAYMIYTSGTTGIPKGTMLSHSGLINLSIEQKKHLQIENSSRILQFSSLSFDASVWEIVMALLNGAALCLTASDIQLTGENLGRVIDRMGITAVTLPPSVLATLPAGEYKSLRTLVTAGEAVSPEIVSQWNKGRNFFNAYGPTETTVCASVFHCTDDTTKAPPIGKPLGNFRLYVLDRNLEPVPGGVPGELCIGGIGLARGYLNQPALTAEKFVPDRFSTKKGERIYRSGDLVRFLEDGNVEFLGRIDGQVKIRGFRIETGEIEAVLKRHESVKDAAVIARMNNGMLYLNAYIVVDETKPAAAADIKNFLRGILPEFMIPAFIIKLDFMPLNSSGKIDRKALPDPDISRVERSEAFEKPENEVQQKLLDILKELLRIDAISINDSFFDIGGHSLLATQYISRIRQELGIELPLRCLFQYPSIRLLDEEIRKNDKGSTNSLQPVIKKAERRKVKLSELEMKS